MEITSRDRSLSSNPVLQGLFSALVIQQASGNCVWSVNLRHTLMTAIHRIDERMSKSLRTIMNHQTFKAIEAKWRGLAYLTSQAKTSSSLKIKILPVSQATLLNDVETAVSADQSEFFHKIVENEFGTAGGEPYSLLIADYQFSHANHDMRVLQHLAQVGSAAFCPILSAAAPGLLGFQSWAELPFPRELENLVNSSEYIEWQSFRRTEESRYINLCVPRVLARLPYTPQSIGVSFNFEEQSTPEECCWMNAAYTLGQCILHSVHTTGWPTTIRGAQAGGKITGLPLYHYQDAIDKKYLVCPTEVNITDRREYELSQLGLIPLCYYKNSDYAVFFGAQSLQTPKKYDLDSATANAQISARLPYILASSRIAHYLKIIARDQLGQFMSCQEVSDWLNRWILQYVNGNDQSSALLKAGYPLAEAKIQVEEVPGKPGAYQAIAWLKPWLQFEELNCSLRLVADIPIPRQA